MIKRITRIDWLPFVLFLFSLVVRFTAVQLTQFDGLYGQDSFAYANYARDLFQALAAAQPPPPFFWPLGYPLLVVLLMLMTSSAAVAGQNVSIVAGAAIAPLVYILVRAYQPQAQLGAVLAGLLSATAAQLLLSSLSVMSDTAALLWGTLSMWLMVRYVSRLQLRWLAAAAALISMATLTRWLYGLLIVPWGLAAFFAWLKAGYPLRRMATAVTIAVLIGLSFILLHAYGSLAQAELSHTGDIEVVLTRWHPRYAFTNVVTNSDGRFEYEYITGYFYARPTFHPAYIFPLLAPLWLLGIWTIRRQAPALLTLVLGWPLLIYLFLAGVPWQNWRFPLTFFTPLLILVGLGFDWVWQRLSRSWQLVFMAYCALSLVGSGLWAVRDVGRFAAWTNEQKQAALAIEAQLPEDATLIAFGLTATIQYYTAVSTQELFYLDETDLAQLVAGETAVYLLLDPNSVQTQWADKQPELNFRWLQAHANLIQIGQYDPFILYQIIPEQNDSSGLSAKQS